MLAEVKSELDGQVPAELVQPAIELFEQVALADEFVDFLTLPAYDRIG